MHSENHNKLFLVCPFCQIEHQIMRQFGEVFFCTAPASYSNMDELFLQSLYHLIMQEDINELYLVEDKGCSLLQSSMDSDSGYHFLQNIHQMKSASDDIHTWAEKLIDDQMEKLQSLDFIQERVSAGRLSLYTISLDPNGKQFIARKNGKKWDSGLLSAT